MNDNKYTYFVKGKWTGDSGVGHYFSIFIEVADKQPETFRNAIRLGLGIGNHEFIVDNIKLL